MHGQRRWGRNRGFTFIELMIVLAIFLMLMVVAVQTLLTGRMAWEHGALHGYVDGRAADLSEDLGKELIDAGNITTDFDIAVAVANQYYRIQFQVPTEDPVSGLVIEEVAGEKEVIWGAIDLDGDPVVGSYYRYEVKVQLEAEDYRIREDDLPNNDQIDLVEATSNVDYNGDGDMTDSFRLGRLEKLIVNNAGELQGSRVIITRDLLLPPAHFIGDVDGDGFVDTPFEEVSNQRIEIMLFVQRTDMDNQQSFIRTAHTVVATRNP